MSGHSKWATIHRQKEITDAKRGQAWTKITNAIIVAVRETGIGDPDKNFKLRLTIEKARSLNMPKDNIIRAISRATGEREAGKWEEVVYEGFGPAGICVMIETLTDNKQRTVQELKNIFDRAGGKLAGPGSVSFQFEQMGLLTLEKPVKVEEAILKIIDLGALDVEETPDGIEVYTQTEKLEELRINLQDLGFNITGFELSMKPKTTISIRDKETAQKILSFMEKIEEQAEVQKVFANFDIEDQLIS